MWWPLWARSPKAGYASAGQPTNTKYSNNKREREKIKNNHRDRQDVFSDLQTNTKCSKEKEEALKTEEVTFQRHFVKTKEREITYSLQSHTLGKFFLFNGSLFIA